MNKRLFNRILPGLCAALALVCAGCDGVLPPAATPSPFESAPPALSPGTAGSTPGPSPTAAPEQPAGDGYELAELIGIPAPEDVHPVYNSYGEACVAAARVPDSKGSVIGWITIPGTAIDYPVCQSSADDDTFYLDHDLEGRVSKYGAIYMDTRNAEHDQRQHVLIYGHNMRNGTMFHDLMNYKQQEFFAEHRYITLLWDGEETLWQVYLASSILSANVHFSTTRFGNGTRFASFIEEMRSYAESASPSFVDPSITVGPKDQVLTLSICTYAPPDAREQGFIVQARRIH